MRLERVYDWRRGEGLVERDPQSLDLEMPAPETTRLGLLSDTHLGKGKAGERRRELRRWLDAFDGLGAAGVVHSGDLVEDPGDDQEVRWALETLEETGIPVFAVPGNHDVEIPGEENEIIRRLGPFPRGEKIGQVQLWLLDSMTGFPLQERDQRERESAKKTGFFSKGAVGGEQLKQVEGWMGGVEGAQVLVVHHHLRQPLPAKPSLEKNAEQMGPLIDADELLALAGRTGVSVILHGHRHQYTTPYMPFEEFVIVNGGSSTPDRPPRRARVLDISHDGEAVRIWELVRFA